MDVYLELKALEDKYNALYKLYVELKERVYDMQCEAEVEHFLEHGAGCNHNDWYKNMLRYIYIFIVTTIAGLVWVANVDPFNVIATLLALKTLKEELV